MLNSTRSSQKIKAKDKIYSPLPKFLHECQNCVCEQAQLTEVINKQQIGAYEGFSTVVNLAVSYINSTRRLEEEVKNQTKNNK